MQTPRVFTALLLYLIVVIGLVLAQPALLFDSQGKPKPFGLGLKHGASILAPSVLFPLLALLFYIIVIWMKLMTNT